MFTGYLQLGEVEIANTDRLIGYSRTADCPAAWIKQQPCGTLEEALNHARYVASNISEAPWYDPTRPELSSRFYGVTIIDVENRYDSTRSMSLTESIGDGGVIGDSRHGMKSLNFKAYLLASGEDALDYGLDWLSSALEPGACGQHGSACGFSDLAFFTTCPPPVPELWVPEDGGVAALNRFENPRFLGSGTKFEVRRNLHPNPDPWTSGVNTGYAAHAPEATLTREGQALRWTAAASGNMGVRFSASSMTSQTGEPYRMMLRVRASRTISATARMRGGLSPKTLNFGTGWVWFYADVVAGSSASDFYSGLLVHDVQLGDWVEVARVCVEHDPTVRGSWFTGDGEGQGVAGTSTDPDFTARWLGTPHASESVLEGEQARLVPQTGEWGALAVSSGQWSSSGGASLRVMSKPGLFPSEATFPSDTTYPGGVDISNL